VASWDGGSSSNGRAIDIMNAISFNATRRTRSVVAAHECLTEGVEGVTRGK